MKTMFLIIIGISVSVFLIGVILYPTINEVIFDDDNLHDVPTALSDIPPIHPKPELNTIIIYDVTENDKTRLSITPHTLVMNLTKAATSPKNLEHMKCDSYMMVFIM